MKRAISSIISSIVSSEEPRIGDIFLTLRRSPRARRLRLRVDARSGAVLLTVPPSVSRRRALAWAADHHHWVEEALRALPPRLAVAPGVFLPWRGRPHRLDWDPSRPRRVAVADGMLCAGGPAEGLENRVLRWMKSEALLLLREETADFAALAGVMPSRIAVGDPVSRWGSCSSAGAIRYSWRLVMAPDWVRRATVAHEVAHLVHMNHGPSFHILVEALLGTDPAPARTWLRREGAALHRVGS